MPGQIRIKYNVHEHLLLKPEVIVDHQEVMFRIPIHEPNNRPTFNVLQKKKKREKKREMSW
jgi:hypothetical protein